MGTSSQILQSQLAPITAAFEGIHEFFYIDGIGECDPADGVEEVFPGPYFCHYNLPTHNLVSCAHEFVLDIMELEGPFDGVIGFSQGAALAASMMLQHAKDNPEKEELFKLAIFAGASLPYNLDNVAGPAELESKVEGSGILETEPVAFPGPVHLSSAPFLCLYNPETETETARITVPTLHLIGHQDPFSRQGNSLVKLCSGITTVVRHDSGHEIPCDKLFVQKATASLEQLIHTVTFQV
ncbi:predicted protein [Uncinocarpus reesii 1704]|uniref:Serine hydrolase domain-containing protein n=1 Tax=Uncinocarpus reesii (strain UAMH 1704) TaxID=336963 RepID=C4JU61_UNCRE|nr:uncharacterized protein UREG_06000 [Uncinocarpus reesii 1704]EEP81158.1 predicted protein [Uncinocarpus reesii 1704]